jgi:hypothetical protein
MLKMVRNFTMKEAGSSECDKGLEVDIITAKSLVFSNYTLRNSLIILAPIFFQKVTLSSSDKPITMKANY